jgi:hypothetical protein
LRTLLPAKLNKTPFAILTIHLTTNEHQCTRIGTGTRKL